MTIRVIQFAEGAFNKHVKTMVGAIALGSMINRVDNPENVVKSAEIMDIGSRQCKIPQTEFIRKQPFNQFLIFKN
jgi:hypothetical protein